VQRFDTIMEQPHMRFRPLVLTPLLLVLAACSPPPPANDTPVIAASSRVPAPANPVLGSPAWYAWVNQTLGLEGGDAALAPGSASWNQAVQERLGQEAPQAKPGSPEWQQSVDALLRTRAPAAQ
jgi:hypothetical protein